MMSVSPKTLRILKRTSQSKNDPSDYKSSIDDFNKKPKLQDPVSEVTGKENSGSSSSSDDDGDDGDSDDEPAMFRGAPWENPELSDYEKMILKNIEARNQFMIKNGFPEAVRDLNTCLPSKPVKPENKPAKKKIIQKKNTVRKQESPLPRREPSRRLRNLAAKMEEEVKKEVAEGEGEDDADCVDNRLLDSADMSVNMNSIADFMSEMAEYKPDLNLAECSITEYRDQIRSIPLLKVKKVMPGRIQSTLIHPQTNKTIVLVGDKYGNFGVWMPMEGDGEVIVHQIHRAPLNCLSVAKEDRSKVYSTGHDGVVVQTDFSAEKFVTMYATDWSERITHLTWHDEFEPQRFLVAHGRGDVGILDARAGKEIQEWIDCFPKSIRTVQHHPVQENYFLASSGATRSFKIFDLRRSTECICEMEHPKGLTSAFFSPSGTRIVTTCHDDLVRVFDSSVLTSKFPNVACYKHNNMTGRWLTSFRANWVPQRDDVFHVGSLLNPRRIQFYKADNGGILCDVFHDEVQTVCSAISMHPTLTIFSGANSSGKVHLFGPADPS